MHRNNYNYVSTNNQHNRTNYQPNYQSNYQPNYQSIQNRIQHNAPKIPEHELKEYKARTDEAIKIETKQLESRLASECPELVNVKEHISYYRLSTEIIDKYTNMYRRFAGLEELPEFDSYMEYEDCNGPSMKWDK
jgi:hypothetical protein